MSVEQREASDSGRQQQHQPEKTESLYNRTEMKNFHEDTSKSSKTESDKLDSKKNESPLFNTNDLYAQNSSQFRSENGMPGDMQKKSALTADGKPNLETEEGRSNARTADGKFDPEGKGNKDVKTAEGKMELGEKGQTVKTAEGKVELKDKSGKPEDLNFDPKAPENQLKKHDGVKTAEYSFNPDDTSKSVKTADGKFDPNDKSKSVTTADQQFTQKFDQKFDGINRNQQSSLEASEPVGRQQKHKPDAQLKEHPQHDHVVNKGETLDKITNQELGKKSSDGQRETFKEAVRSINNLSPDQKLSKGQELKLPGVNEKGEFVHKENGVERTWNPKDGSNQTKTADGTKVTNFKDNSTRIESPNGDVISTKDGATTVSKPDNTTIRSDAKGERTTTPEGVNINRDADGKLKSVDGSDLQQRYQKGTDGHGGTVEREKGDRPEANFTLIQSKDGQRMEVADKGPDGKERISELRKEESLKEPRKELMDKAEKNIKSPEELAKFKADMVRFEQRSADRGMSDKEVADTYKQVGRIFDGGPNEKLGQADRNTIAEQVMSNAASPTSIDQGKHNTCALTTLESKIYSQDPSKAAKLVADTVVDGQFKGSDGTVVKPDASALKPDAESRTHPPKDGSRSFASQIFQVTAANLFHQQDSKYLPPSKYTQDTPNPSDPTDTVEKLKPFIGKEKDHPGFDISGKESAKTHELITGRKDSDVFLRNEQAGKGDGKYPSNDKSIGTFNSPEQLHEKLSQLKREGKFPAILGIHAGRGPFSDSGEHGGHVVNITDYDPEKREAKVDNQWGSQNDHIEKPIKVDELYKHTMTEKNANQFEKDRAAQREVDIRKDAGEQSAKENPNASPAEKDLKALGIVSEKGGTVTGKELAKVMEKAAPEWKQQQLDGTFDPQKQKDFLKDVDKVFDKMSYGERLQFLGSMRGAGSIPGSKIAMPDQQYNDMFSKTIQDRGWNQDSVRIKMDSQIKNPEYQAHTPKEDLKMFGMLRNMPDAQRDEILGKLPRMKSN